MPRRNVDKSNILISSETNVIPPNLERKTVNNSGVITGIAKDIRRTI